MATQYGLLSGSSSSNGGGGSSGLSGGKIAGAVIGSVVGAVLLCALLAYLVTRGNKSGSRFSADKESPHQASGATYDEQRSEPSSSRSTAAAEPSTTEMV